MIPKIIHRVIPRKTTKLIDNCWDSVLKNTNDWDHFTHYDDGDYEYVGEYLSLCPRGAYKADLIRLEQIYKYGGIYLDSDIFLYKNIDFLLNSEIFLSYENDQYVVNGIIGAEPKNEHILNMLNMSIDLVKNKKLIENDGLFSDSLSPHDLSPFGPYVVNQYCLNKNDIIKLPSSYFTLFYGTPQFMDKMAKRCLEKNLAYGRHIYNGSINIENYLI